jgi:FkbM family methyltransferase
VTDGPRLPLALRTLLALPWEVKRAIARRPLAWRAYVSACHRLGWGAPSTLGWHRAANGPFAGLLLEAWHVNHLWIPAGTYEPVVSGLLTRLVDERARGGTVWDVGANVGLTALLFARHGAARVVALEPSAANRDRLRRQLAANPAWADRIELLEVAASDEEGAIDFHDATSSSYSQVIADEVVPWSVTGSVSRVPTVPLDRLLQRGHPPPQLLKIDVEGAEAMVLRGARELLRRARPTVLVEVHNPAAAAATQQLLEQAGLRCRVLDENGHPRPITTPIRYGHYLAD